MSSATDERTLVRQTRDGHNDAFAELVERHQQVVFGYLRARLIDPTDAEDLTQEAFLRFFVNKDRFDEAGSVRSWLIGIARNLLYEHIRRMKRRREVAWTEMCLELDELTQSEPQCCDDGVTELNGCLESLADPAREALEMRYRSNLRLAQIGNRLRRSTGAVKLLMFRARQKLRHCMDNKTGGRGDD